MKILVLGSLFSTNLAYDNLKLSKTLSLLGYYDKLFINFKDVVTGMKKVLIPIFLAVLLGGLFVSLKANKFPNNKIFEFIGEGTPTKDGTIVLHKEKVETGIVLFHSNRKESYNVNARFVKKNFLGWNTTNDGAYLTWGPKEIYKGPTTHFFPTTYKDAKSPLPMIMGAIQEPKVKDVKITYEYGGKSKSVKATTIDKEGRHVFFAFLEKPKSQTIYKIVRYDANGKIIEKSKLEAQFP